MDEVIERVITTFAMMRSIDRESFEASKLKLRAYMETLTSAGQTDSQKLAVCGLTYLRELYDGAPQGATVPKSENRFSGKVMHE